jgi:hypothetical protein
MKFKVGDEVIITFNFEEVKGKNAIIVEHQGKNQENEDVYWIKLKSGDRFILENAGTFRNNNLEVACWEGWLKSITKKDIEVYGIVKFLASIEKGS